MNDRVAPRHPRDIAEDRLAEEQAALDPDLALLSRYVDGELDARERESVERRLESDPDFQRLADPLLAVARVPPLAPAMSREELERQWLELRRRIGLPEIPGHPVPDAGSRVVRQAVEWRRRAGGGVGRRVLQGAAAVLVLALGAPLAGNWYERTFDYQRVETAANASAEVALPDGSRATLAGGSTLRFRHDFAAGGPRRVFLDGEAGFSVVRGESTAPFEVHAAGAVITVVGTGFTVHGYGSEPVLVTVRSGSVRVQSFDDRGDALGDALLVSAGQRARAGTNVRPAVVP